MLERSVITIKGTTAAGEFKTFTGIVLSLDEDRARPTRSRWRVTMQDTANTADAGKLR